MREAMALWYRKVQVVRLAYAADISISDKMPSNIDQPQAPLVTVR